MGHKFYEHDVPELIRALKRQNIIAELNYQMGKLSLYALGNDVPAATIAEERIKQLEQQLNVEKH